VADQPGDNFANSCAAIDARRPGSIVAHC